VSNENNFGLFLNKTDGFNLKTITKYKYSIKVDFNNNFPIKKDMCTRKSPCPYNIKNAFESQIVFS